VADESESKAVKVTKVGGLRRSVPDDSMVVPS